MKEYRPIGAVGGHVTGSGHLLKSNKDTQILVEFGMFQGPGSDIHNQSLKTHDLTKVKAGFVTHGHLDHVGGLPCSPESEFPIYASRASAEIMNVGLKNSDLLSRLYPEGSVNAVLKRIVVVPYDSPIKVDGLTATFRNAGHILGSASLEIQEENGEKLIFSGDIGNPKSSIVKPKSPLKQADIIIMETTYGDRCHSAENPNEAIEDAIKWINRTGGTLLIPSFAIDRTQNILNRFKKLSRKNKLKNVRVYLDSPMGVAITSIYKNHPELLSEELLSEELPKRKNPFVFPELYVIPTFKESQNLDNRRGPMVIIAGSGMLTGGRMEGHLRTWLSDSKSMILFSGYCVEGAPGRAIIDGDKDIEINYEIISVNARVGKIPNLSAHADQQELMNWISPIIDGNETTREAELFLVHGNNSSREGFKEQVELKFGDRVHVSLPNEGEVYNLWKNS